MADAAGGRLRPGATLFPGWTAAALREDAGGAEEESEAAKAEPMGRGEPTARGVGSEGCGAQERTRVGPGFDDGTGARLGPGVEAAGTEFAGAGGAGVGVKGSRSVKRAKGRPEERSGGRSEEGRSPEGGSANRGSGEVCSGDRRSEDG